MPKKHIKRIAIENELDFEEACKLAREKLSEDQISGRGNNIWIDEDGQKVLHAAAFAPEIVPKHFHGIVLYSAPNPSYVYAHIKEIEKKVPVVIPRRLRGKLDGKRIMIEAITDDLGVSYRYVKA